ncbi:MAG: hypothetical protein KAY11_19685 [Ilumatobacteraceae bacterium]|nr:hypothetical protein [Ilumatobacteraceae bacterium]
MADNPTVDNGAGTDYVVATDDDGTAQHQYVKLEFGADNTQTKVDGSNPLPVVQTGALPAGTAAIGKLAANTGVDIGDVDVTSVVPGTAATSLGKAVDSAAGATDTGVAVLLVRDDALATLTPVDNDYTVGRTNARGAQWVALDSTAAQTVTLAASTATQEVVGDVAEDAVLGGNPLRVGGRASTATPTAMSADGDMVTAWLDRSGASVVTGYVAEDGALTGNPSRQGVRAHSAVPTAMSANNDVVTPWADRSGALVVIPQPRTVRVAATPTIATSAYVAGDQVGGLLTFTSAALATGRSGQVLQAVLTSRTPTATNALELWLFAASPTLAGSDNAAFDLTDANLEAGLLVGIITFTGTDYVTTASGAACMGVPKTAGAAFPSFVTSGSANLFGVLVARTVAAQYAGTTDLVVALTVNQF